MGTRLTLSVSSEPDIPGIIGASAAMELARKKLARFAPTSLAVLLVGPTGTGKDLLARHLHVLSGRSGELIDVNCGALPREMIESLLFGHRKGAFTGASETTIGCIARANLGTLFLDELSSLPIEGQAKLLRVLETGEVLPLGACVKQRIDFRLIAAVHDDIDAKVEAGLFRRDLFHRVAGIRIDLPALTDRREDIPALAIHFARAHGCAFTPAALGLLKSQHWPGNVRELRSVIDRLAVLADGLVLDEGIVLEGLNRSTVPVCGVCETELMRICRAHSGRAQAIAEALGVSRATLFRKLRASGISLTSLKVS